MSNFTSSVYLAGRYANQNVNLSYTPEDGIRLRGGQYVDHTIQLQPDARRGLGLALLNLMPHQLTMVEQALACDTPPAPAPEPPAPGWDKVETSTEETPVAAGNSEGYQLVSGGHRAAAAKKAKSSKKQAAKPAKKPAAKAKAKKNGK